MRCTKKVHNSQDEASQFQLMYYLSNTDVDILQAEKLFKVYWCRYHRGWHITTIKTKGNEMSNFDVEIKWDEQEEVDPIQTGSYPDWGLLKLVASKNVTLFSKGATLTLSDVLVNGQPFSRNGIKDGGTTRAFFFTLDGENTQTGEPFRMVKMYTSSPQYDIEDASKYPHIYLDESQKKYLAEKGKTRVSDWVNLQKPAFNATLGKQTAALQTTGLWVKAETTVYEVREDATQTDSNGKPKKYYTKYWHNFTVYPTKEAMEAARKAEGGNNGVAPSPYPVTWDTTGNFDLNWYLNYSKEQFEKIGNLKEAAIKVKLLNADGSFADTPNGDRVAVETIASVFNKTVEEVKQAGIVDSPF